MSIVLFPGWRWGPEGQCELFQREEDVPEGWTRDHPANWPDGVFPGTAKPAPPVRRDPFDHDGDGKPGGSLKGAASTASETILAAFRRVKPGGNRK